MASGSEYIIDERVIDRSGDIDQRPPGERAPGEDRLLAIMTAQLPQIRSSRVPEDPQLPAERGMVPFTAAGHENHAFIDVSARLQKTLDKAAGRAVTLLDAIVRKIEAQERRCVPPKLDDELQQLRFERQKLLISNGPALADCLREENSRAADLLDFKARHNIERDPHYPSSQTLALGILSMLILVEAGLNGVLFADSSKSGLLGGWLEAFILSLTNVGLAFLFGRLVLPQFHRASAATKVSAAFMTAICVAAIASINLLGAHYRDYRMAVTEAERSAPVARARERAAVIVKAATSRAERPSAPGPVKKPVEAPLHSEPALPAVEPAAAEPLSPPPVNRLPEEGALARAVAAPFVFQSFASFFLFAIGLCAATIAAWDGYEIDDPFPGYGQRHRKLAAARERTADVLKRVLNQSNAIVSGSVQSITRKIEAYEQEISSLQSLHHAYAGELQALQEQLHAQSRDAEEKLVCEARLAHKTRRELVNYDTALATKQLPALNAKHIKFIEMHQRKLAALQKSSLKEQSAVLNLFEEAAADFQRLLAATGHGTSRLSAVAG